MKIKLTRAFAADRAANENDVRQLKETLNRMGYYRPLETIGITGMPDRNLQTAIRNFQKDQELPPTGNLLLKRYRRRLFKVWTIYSLKKCA